ncbi:MAG TPA: threonine/serine dehydratase [Firmicutes bacterium]|nr:threonine/serine dehydratase [Bacillota bacterium]
MLSLLDIIGARHRLRGRVRETPLVRSSALSRRAGRPVYMKLECWQQTGSFKVRGALNFLLQLAPDQGRRGLVTASAGNHGLGTAFGCRLLGLPLTVVVPSRSPQVKKEGIRAQGAQLLEVEGGYDIAHAAALRLATEHGLTYVPAAEDERIMAGHGTIALEAVDQLGTVPDFLVPVGGGGLVAGVGVAAHALDPSARVIGVQSEATPAMYRSLQAGHPVPVEDLPTLCEGLAGNVEPIGFQYGRTVIDAMHLVSEEEVADAICFLVREHRLLVEGSGGVGIAAILSSCIASAESAHGRPIVVVLSGSNIDAPVLAHLLTPK